MALDEPSSIRQCIIPPLHRKIIPPTTQQSLRAIRNRAKDTAINASKVSPRSNISDFLEQTASLLTSKGEYFRAYQSGLQDAVGLGKLGTREYNSIMEKLDETFMPVYRVLRVLKRQRRALEEDLEDESGKKKANADTTTSTIDEDALLHSAYVSIIVSRAMSMGVRKPSIDEIYISEFRKFQNGVIAYLNAVDGTGLDNLSMYIHAAHLVPKSLEGEELGYLFGNGEVLGGPEKWYHFDLDGRELIFRSDNRPARRFLYFRFIMTYINAKRNGNKKWVDMVEQKDVFWAIPGRHLRRSMLCTLARSVMGVSMPPVVYESNTFESDEDTGDSDLTLAARLREEMILDIYRDTDEETDADADEETGEDEGDEEGEEGGR
ncbi:hypothetical protein FQN50_003130 [Emmonsiellopsis sp. PD_5]|nr:hypothetical protein FQN50_003130 [Emmonsiellopsis sp. PD_5]